MEWFKVRISWAELAKTRIADKRELLMTRLRELGIDTTKPFTTLDDMTGKYVVFGQRRA